ncbi:MAG: MoaD/ThiS family protein [Pyrinomonadaceae bacterium]
MSVRILFFGATAAATDNREIVINENGFSNVSSIIDELIETYPRLTSHKLLCSINHQYATSDDPVRDGDEIAIFTAVSGG